MHMSEAHEVFVENPGGIKPLGRSMHIWESNIEMDLEKYVWRV
jgi:hypothetical protein